MGFVRGEGVYGGLSQSSIPLSIFQHHHLNNTPNPPLKHSGTEYISPTPLPWPSSSAIRCQSLTYNPRPCSDSWFSQRSSTSPNDFSVRSNSENCGCNVFATGTTWCEYCRRAGKFGKDAVDWVFGFRNDLVAGQVDVLAEDKKKGTFGIMWLSCTTISIWEVYKWSTYQEISITEMVIGRERSGWYDRYHLIYLDSLIRRWPEGSHCIWLCDSAIGLGCKLSLLKALYYNSAALKVDIFQTRFTDIGCLDLLLLFSKKCITSVCIAVVCGFLV